MDNPSDITWNHSLEKLLAEEGEKALGQAWLHNQCEEHFGRRSNWISIPVIVLSTLAGTASASANQFFPGQPTITGLGIGSISILTGILSTINSYFAFAKRTEAHRIADIQFNKVFRFISVEMTLPRNERIRAKDMLKIVREQIERLAETSPQVPEFICDRFRKHFGKNYMEVAQPDITNGLRKININSAIDAVETPRDFVVINPMVHSDGKRNDNGSGGIGGSKSNAKEEEVKQDVERTTS
jgi:hypothetical protein